MCGRSYTPERAGPDSPGHALGLGPDVSSLSSASPEVAMATDPLNVTSDRIQSAVDELFEEELRMLQDLVRIPSLVGQPGEAEVQHYMDRVLREELRLTSVDKWEIALEDVQGKPGSSPIVGEWRDKWGVVGVHKPSGEPKVPLVSPSCSPA